MRIIDFIMYAILLGAVIFVTYLDKKDWECPDPWISKDKCEGVEMALWNTKPNSDDDIPQLVEKINKASKVEGASVKWRRSLLLSAIIVLLIFILVITPGYLPQWPKFYVSVLIGFAILYFQFSYYSYHRYKDGEENIQDATKILKEKCS